MKQLSLVFSVLFLYLSPISAQEGFLAVEQWPGLGMTYTGGIYFNNGINFQVQYAGTKNNWLFAGYATAINDLNIEFNGGAIIGRDDLAVNNLSFQLNFSYGDSEAKFNLLTCHEYSPKFKKGYPNIIWAFHRYSFKVANKIFLGASVEISGETSHKGKNLFVLKPGPMMKYWATPDIALILSPRGSIELKKNAKFTKEGGFYLGCVWLFSLNPKKN